MPSERKIGSQAEVVEFIVNWRTENGVPPSVREIAQHWGVAAGTAQSTLRRMFDDGVLRRAPGISRGITVSEAAMKALDNHV